jgi:hypothetical protein
MRTILALLLTYSLAWAAPPADAPLNPHLPGRSLHLTAGEMVPFDGQLVSDSEHARREWNSERTAGELEALKRGNTIMLVALLGTGTAAVVTAVVLGVALAAKR